ncbi:acyltransferase [Sansalvadorimonas sp. 2012CJ34-2]|uniref:Chloramphenicol acetyltransferase n=1 Tax=Parendozoicomonas callyspongiae TaxID=2942213 RepID=A0ABT0PL16_9GAMM|nr:acyltransferase [Sansalvadorimonas sp. 2012CJ34-2]MCL6272033.1 acyltransferase [Sansalvadorimonas sp. 2012CJ34-2]
MMNIEKGYYTQQELKSFNFNYLGEDVLVSRNSTIIGTEYISINSNSRIDDYCTLVASEEGEIIIGKHVHIAGYSLLSAGSGIELHDFSGISHGVKIYGKTDDYSGKHLTNPTVSSEFTGAVSGKVTLGRHTIIGSGSVILPRVNIGDGVAVGANSLVTKSLDEWCIYFGSPVKKIKKRSQELLKLEKKFLKTKA